MSTYDSDMKKEISLKRREVVKTGGGSASLQLIELQDKRLMGHIAYLRKQFKINKHIDYHNVSKEKKSPIIYLISQLNGSSFEQT